MADKDSLVQLIEEAESKLISTTPGAVPPHFDDGGHLPFGGTIGNTRGPSAFGKRKMTRANALGNPQALLLNYPPENNEATLKCWERNYKSSIYEDPSAEAERLITTNNVAFGYAAVFGGTPAPAGFADRPSYLIDANQTWGNIRRTASTRPTPAPPFYPPPRDATSEQIDAASYSWKWPERQTRTPMPQIARPEKVTQTFLQEYELRPPWLKY